jgi:hypothetical protein
MFRLVGDVKDAILTTRLTRFRRVREADIEPGQIAVGSSVQSGLRVVLLIDTRMLLIELGARLTGALGRTLRRTVLLVLSSVRVGPKVRTALTAIAAFCGELPA